MPSLSDDFQMPIMYKDLRDPNLGMLPMPTFGMYTNYLGGIKLPREIQNDQFVYKNRAVREKNTLKKVGIALAGLAGVIVLKQKGAFKYLGTQLKSAGNWIQNLFKSSKPKPTP